MDIKDKFMNAILMEDFFEAMRIIDDLNAFEFLALVSELHKEDAGVFEAFLEFVDTYDEEITK